MTTNGTAISTIHRRRNTRPRGRPNSQNRVVLGTGLSIWHGTVKEEYLSQLGPWSREFKVYQQMADDVVIGGMLESIITPMLAAEFEVQLMGDTDDDKEAQTFAHDNLFGDFLDEEWVRHVEDTAEMLRYGFSISEKVVEKRGDGRLWLKALSPIGQETLHVWGDPDNLGNVTGFTQLHDGKLITAPMEKLLHFVFQGRKKNPQGRSLLRALYRPWYFKTNLEALEAIGVERDVGNAPVATMKEGVRYTDAQITAIEKALQGFRMDDAMYVILPGGVVLDAYGGGNKVYDIRQIIRDYQHLIRQRFFADFLALGSEQVGTQALAREMTTFFSLALKSVQQRMVAVWNRQLIPWLFAVNNWVPTSGVPKLQWLPPGDQNIQSLAQAMQMLVTSGILTPDLTIENRVRKALELKTITEEEAALRKQQPLDRAATGGVGGDPTGEGSSGIR